MMFKTIITILALLFICSCKQTDSNKLGNDGNEINRELKKEVDSLMAVNDSLTKLIPEEKADKSIWYDPEYDSRNLVSQGISDPEIFIKNSLQEKPELIPSEAVLGGTMRFIDIQPLGTNWVIAYYEDGHVGGRAIYRYMLNNDQLEFKLLDFHEI